MNNPENKVYELLRSKGYPQDAILYNPSILVAGTQKTYAPDFALIDPVRKRTLAYVEVQGSLEETVEGVLTRNKEFYRQVTNTEHVPLYLIVCTEVNGTSIFRLYDYSKGANNDIPIDLFPTFEALAANSSDVRRSSLAQEKRQTYDSLWIFSTVMAIFLLALLAVDVNVEQTGVRLLTKERIAVIGLAIVLLILPFAQKIKGFGLEWERG